jgi:hypothetical protein
MTRTRTWLIGVVLLVAACGGGTADTTAEPTTSADSTTPAATALDDAMLLDAAEMPAWNNAGTWQPVDDAQAVRACDLPSADDVGATISISRSFEFVADLQPGDVADPATVPMLGISTVAAYPDDAAAEQAVTQWVDALGACDAVQLGTVAGGSTWTFSAPDPASPDNAFFDFVGVAAVGSRTTLVAFSVNGQDANNEGDPLADSLDAAVARLP